MNYRMNCLNPNRYGLALHTSSPQLGLSLSNFAGDRRTQTWDLERELSTYLHQYLVEFIVPQAWQDLAFIAVATGPGSFTSTRIGVVTARTLAQQLEIPLFGISTLAAIAHSKCDSVSSHQIFAIQMSATQGKFYGGIYQYSPENASLIAIFPDTLMSADAWQRKQQEIVTSYGAIVAPVHLGMTADSILALAYRDWQAGKRSHWSEVLPFYGI
jgi:tRNA threonylcarbamoyladenosine biosynthesis protein TsaB